jgi:hypothetical protein
MLSGEVRMQPADDAMKHSLGRIKFKAFPPLRWP